MIALPVKKSNQSLAAGQSPNAQRADCLEDMQRSSNRFDQADDYSRSAHFVDCFRVDTDRSADFYCASEQDVPHKGMAAMQVADGKRRPEINSNGDFNERNE
jgi:hypothetical protein